MLIFRYLILFFAVISLLTSCTKDKDSACPTSSSDSKFKILIDEGQFDHGDIDCINPTIVQSNATHLFLLGCNRIYRYDENLNPVDWIGVKGTGEFGIHSLSDQNSSIISKLEINCINNTHIYVRHIYGNSTQDSLIRLDLSTGTASRVMNDELETSLFLAKSDGTMYKFHYDIVNSDHKIKVYNNDGTLKEEVSISGPFALPIRYFQMDYDENIYLLQRIQQENSTPPPYISRYNSSIQKEIEFDTDLTEAYTPQFGVANNKLYVGDNATFKSSNTPSGFISKMELYIYDQEGNLLGSYTTQDSRFLNLKTTFKDMIFGDYDGINNFQAYWVYRVPE